MSKWKFSYGPEKWATVTVSADDRATAITKARISLDNRADKRGWSAPVAWSLRLIEEKPQ